MRTNRNRNLLNYYQFMVVISQSWLHCWEKHVIKSVVNSKLSKERIQLYH